MTLTDFLAAGRPSGNTIASHQGIVIKTSALMKRFGRHSVLNGIDIEVRAGEVAFLIGPSGSGKSTLLRCLNFLERPDSGSIEFEDRQVCWGDSGNFATLPEAQIRAIRSKMPMVFQQFNLFKHKTALENVMLGPVVVNGRTRTDARAAAVELLATFGLGSKIDHYPTQLSGGQQQRVGIARALAMQPEVILFDEPTSALDPELVSEILDIIRSLADKGMTMVIVTHEMAFARGLADRIHFMADGRIVESGTAHEVLSEPKSDRLRSFVAAMGR